MLFTRRAFLGEVGEIFFEEKWSAGADVFRSGTSTAINVHKFAEDSFRIVRRGRFFDDVPARSPLLCTVLSSVAGPRFCRGFLWLKRMCRVLVRTYSVFLFGRVK